MYLKYEETLLYAEQQNKHEQLLPLNIFQLFQLNNQIMPFTVQLLKSIEAIETVMIKSTRDKGQSQKQVASAST